MNLPDRFVRKTPEQCQAILNQRVMQEVAAGARIESQIGMTFVLVRGHRVNHVLHFLLGFPTLGIWWLTVWPALAIFGGEQRSIATVDDFGVVTLQKA